MRSSVISVCGQSLPVQCQTAGDAGISAKLIDVVRVLRVEKDMILDCLRCASLAPKFSSPVENEEILDEASLSFVLIQFRPVQWAEICCEIKRVSTSSNQEEDDEDDDEDNDDEDQTPCRTAIKLKSRRLNNVEENDDHQEQQQRREIEVTLPKNRFLASSSRNSMPCVTTTLVRLCNESWIHFRSFGRRPFCSARQAKPVGTTTFGKRRERILCFMGFLVMYQCVEDRNDLTLMLYGEWRAFESYLCYLKEVRMLSAATIAESLTAAVFVSKWLCREVENPGRNFADVELVRRYRDWRNQQASMAIRERRDETWDELREQSKWLQWDEYCRATQLMRDKFEGHTKANRDAVTLKGANLLHDALLLAMFQALPARSGEVRLLEYMSEEEVRDAKGNLTFRQYADRERLNLLTKRDGKWTMFLAQYKTFRHQGVDVTEFDSEQLHADLVRLLELWLENVSQCHCGWRSAFASSFCLCNARREAFRRVVFQ
jgi:hypothetical protein